MNEEEEAELSEGVGVNKTVMNHAEKTHGNQESSIKCIWKLQFLKEHLFF